MHPPDPIAAMLASLLTMILAWAGLNDIRVRKIPNRAVLAVLVVFVGWVLVHHGENLGSALLAGALAFAIGFALYMFGVVGAGDSKLFAAVALMAGLTLLPLFAIVTALAGGAIGVVSLASRPRRALVMLTLKGKGDFGRGIPYGVAIAIGGVFVIWAEVLQAIPAGP